MREHVDDGEVVRDEERREPELLLQLAEQLEHARLHRHVEGARRLVGDEQLRVERERPRERGALTLPAGQLVREPLAERLRQLHRLEQLVDLRRGRASASRAPVCTMSGSATFCAIVSSGLKLVAGSWKTKPSSLRRGRNSRSRTPSISVPSTRSDPSATGVRPAIARPIVVLPEPLSPTRPSTSPGAIVKLTRSTARKVGRPKRPGVLDDELVRHDDRLRRDGGLGELPVDDLEPRNGGEQTLRVLVLRRGEELLRRGGLDDLALEHHGDAIGEVGDDAHVVGDQDDRGAVLVAQVAQQLEDLGLNGHVEGGRRLVGDDHGRVERQRHRDDDALLLPTRELVRVVVDAALRLGDADSAEHLDGAGLRLALRVLAVRPQPLGELPARRCRPG